MNNKLDWDLVKVIEDVVDLDAPSNVEFAIDMPLAYEEIGDNVCEDCPIDDDAAIFANYLQYKGYGNCEKAVRDFVEKAKYESTLSLSEPAHTLVCGLLDKLLTELYGNNS